MTRKLTFTVSYELIDALSGALFEAGAGGIAEEGTDRLALFVTSEEESERFIAAAREFERLARAIDPDAQVEIDISELSDDWQETWQNALQPVHIAEHWVLRPTHCSPAPDDEDTLWFEPEASFGDGSHPTTQLAASALCRYLEERKLLEPASAGTILDVGAGNGVLCIIAARQLERLGLDRGRIVGVDIDPVAVASMDTNLQLNEITDIEVELGSADTIAEKFDCVVANITADVLLSLADSLRERVASGGTLLLTGLLEQDQEEVKAAFSDANFQLEERKQQGDWALLRFCRRSATAA